MQGGQSRESQALARARAFAIWVASINRQANHSTCKERQHPLLSSRRKRSLFPPPVQQKTGKLSRLYLIFPVNLIKTIRPPCARRTSMLASRSRLMLGRACCTSTLDITVLSSVRGLRTASPTPAPTSVRGWGLPPAPASGSPAAAPLPRAAEWLGRRVQARSFAAGAGDPAATWQNDLGQSLQLMMQGSPDSARELLQKGRRGGSSRGEMPRTLCWALLLATSCRSCGENSAVQGTERSGVQGGAAQRPPLPRRASLRRHLQRGGVAGHPKPPHGCSHA